MFKLKKAQEQKSKILAAMPKTAQEEMVGFALIIIIVAVIILIFIGFSVNSPQKENVESYEVQNFIQSFLQYTTECQNNIERMSIQQLIFSCLNKEQCIDGKNSCDVLNSETGKILDESWKAGLDRPVKGYEMDIKTSANQTILDIIQGNATVNLRASTQPFYRDGKNVYLTLKVYS